MVGYLYRKFFLFLIGCACVVGVQAKVAVSTSIQLHAEKTHFAQTGPYAEVESICKEMAHRYPLWVKCFAIGRSQEGRPILAMALSRTGVLTPQQARRSKTPVVLAIGGTHSGEIDGKDAGLMLVRDLLRQPAKADLLRQQVLLFVPVFNVDGHERPRQFNRPNQNGPLLQGERVTVRRVNLNRDWMLGQTPEMTAMLNLIQQWDPLLTVDMHATDGLRFRHDVSLSMSPMFSPDEGLREAAARFQALVLERITSKGHFPLFFTPVMLDKENPAAGFMLDADEPRYSHVYAVLRNRLGVLVEDQAWEPYANRVQTCKSVLESMLEMIAKHGKGMLDVALNADRNAWLRERQPVHLVWRNVLEYAPETASPSGEMDVRGYEYTIHEHAPVVDGRHITYHTDRPTIWRIPYYAQVEPLLEFSVKPPAGGYLIPSGWAAAVQPYLDRHKIIYRVLRFPIKQVQVEELSLDTAAIHIEPQSYQGLQRASINGRWTPAQVDLMKGAIWVPLNQPKALLAAHLLEPSGPDSLSSWGLFNAVYEITDHVSNHRMLELSQWMYQQDDRVRDLYGAHVYEKLHVLRESYDRRMDDDEVFRNDPDHRLDFWMHELPYHDPTYNRYPILRTALNAMQLDKRLKGRPQTQ